MTGTKTIVITGASSGIGAALTRCLQADGHRLFVCARRAERLDEITDGGALATPVICDVGDANDVRAFAEHVRTRTDSVDALINCAGAYGAIGPVLEVDSEAWFATLRTNVLGAFNSVQSFAPLMRGSGQSSIINFAGGGAFDPLPNYSGYAVSKAGIVRLTETLARELAADNIAVNAVAPGFVATEIHDATLAAGRGQAGDALYNMTRKKLKEGSVPIEIPVACVRFLISPDASGLTGKTLSASFDPWDTETFQTRIEELNGSPLYTMQRINLVHLEGDDLARTLTVASNKKHEKNGIRAHEFT